MGNSIIKSSEDNRFNDTLLATEVKKIMMDKTSNYNNMPIKQFLAEACCKDVIKTGINDPKNVVLIAFPKALDKNDSGCVNNKKCLERTTLAGENRH